MVTKGIVETVINNFTAKVRCPVYDKIIGADLYNKDLNISTICTTTGSTLNLNKGDIVFIGFEDDNLMNPVILGYLGIKSESYSDIDTLSINISNSLKLPQDTSIGDITSYDISNLNGLSSNLKNQLDGIETKFNDSLDLLEDNNKKLEEQNNILNDYENLLESYRKINDDYLKLIGNKDDTDEKTIYGKINSCNKKIETLNKSLGVVNEGISISNELNDLFKLYDELVKGICETTPSLDTDSNYMLGRAEKMINVAWASTSSFKQWNSSKVFEANKTYYGMPYTLFGYGYKYDTWKKYANKNVTASGEVSGYGYREGPKYGSCCADFVSEVLGLPKHIRSCTGLLNNSKYLTKLENDKAKASNIKAGDSLVSSSRGHVIWIGKVSDNELVVYEQTPPLARKKTVSLSNTSSGFLKYNGSVYKYLLRPTEELLNLDVNKQASNVNTSNNWIYKGNKKYNKYGEQSLTDSEYLNNGLVFWKLVKKAGWTAEAAAGAWSNTYGESTGNPWSYGTGGGGLFGFTPFDESTYKRYGSKVGIYDYANDVLHNPERRWNGDDQVGYINWQIKEKIPVFFIRKGEKYWKYNPPENTNIPKTNFGLSTYIKLDKKNYGATPTICAKLWLARYGVVDMTYPGRDLNKTINNHAKKAEELYQLFIKY